MDDLYNIIIDNGSYAVKAGFYHYEEPCITRNFRFKLKEKYPPGYSNINVYYGEKALEKARMFGPPNFVYDYPKNHGVITNWNSMKRLLEQIFIYELRNPPEETSLFMIDSSFEDIQNFRKWSEIIFEFFNIKSFFHINESIPPLYALGKTTGIVINSGDSFTSVTPILNGKIIQEAAYKIHFGGYNLTLWLNKLTKNNVFKTSFEREEILYKIKEKFCFVLIDRENAIRNNASFSETYFSEKNGNISIDKERFECPEMLFNPGLFGLDQMGISEMLLKSINKCDENIRNEMMSNIVLSGGSTLFKGFKERIDKEMNSFHMPVNVIAPPDRICETWKGGKILASQDNIKKQSITKTEYDEVGLDKIIEKYF